MIQAQRRLFRALIPLAFLIAPTLSPLSCSCTEDEAPTPPLALVPCATPGKLCPSAPPLDAGAITIIPGTLAGNFSVTSGGDAAYSAHLLTVKGRNKVEPDISLHYNSASGGDGFLGVGFSLTGASIISRCPSNLAQDGEIRDVRFDAKDKLCLDGRRLVPVADAPGILEFRTVPDTFVKVIGHYPEGMAEKTPNNALSFEAHLPSGLTVEYGTGGSGKPLALGGVPRAFLATKVHDGRGNAMMYSYCMADRGGYTAEYALTQIRYTSFEGSPSLEPSRAVRYVYSTRDREDIRIHYERGMALQTSLRLDEIQMLGPGDSLVWRYLLGYDKSPTTNRTRLISIQECGDDGACKPPTHFQYKTDAPGFKATKTNLAAPTSRRASPMVFDINGDGLDDLVVPDTNPVVATPQDPITDWLVALNKSSSGAPVQFDNVKLAFSEEFGFVDNPTGSTDPALIQPDVGTSFDYNQDGKTDILLHDVHGFLPNWQVLLSQPKGKVKLHDTGIPRPFPLGTRSLPPDLRHTGASAHFADLDGDQVQDLILCGDHGDSLSSDPTKPVWEVHFWRKAAAGWDPVGEVIEPLTGTRCESELYTPDLDSDGKADLVMETYLTFDDGTELPAANYFAFMRRSDGKWEVFDTHLPVTDGRLVFMDVNADGLPDVTLSGYGDHALRTYLNIGPTFAKDPINSIGKAGAIEQDTFFPLAVSLDYNGDGRGDLLMPVPGGMLPNHSNALPSWAILQANTGGFSHTAFTLVDPQIPFEAELGAAIMLADPRGPRAADVTGDGAPDVVLPLSGVYSVFENLAPDQDLLIAVADGMNDHEPGEPGFVPSVGISYGHLSDPWITNGSDPADPALESYLYVSRSNPANECDYPRHCSVGPRRVVSAYSQNDGEGGERRFGLRYRDGRYHRLGFGDLGFEKRIVTDLDTGAGTADFYDNRTFSDTGKVRAFAFTHQSIKQWRWVPALPGQPKPGPIDLFFTDGVPAFVPTNDDETYFTVPIKRRTRHVEGLYPPPQDPAKSIEAYAANVESKGGGTVLRDTTLSITKVDAFGNVLGADVGTIGVDLTLHIERTVKNDTDTWVLGQLQTQKECSFAAMQTQCRTLTRTSTPYGEIDTENVASEDKNPETKLGLTYIRDAFGNVTDVIADDAYGHHRAPHTDFDPDGIFPVSHTNAAGHTTILEFDPGLGVLKKEIDPNQLITTLHYDSVGRLDHVTRPGGSETTITRSRIRADGPTPNSWRMTQATTTSGGDDELVEYDSMGRAIRVFSHGPDTVEQAGLPPRVMQTIAYDRLSGNVERRSVPLGENTPEAQILYDAYEYDAMGREVQHVTPWKATTATTYKGLTIEVTDPAFFVTRVESDALGRPVKITDAMKGTTSYTYGPFDTLYTVTDPGGAITRTTRDAFGRVWKLDEPDRGTTIQVHNGFGQLSSSTDALGRVVTFEVDALGRTKTRTDKNGAEVTTTKWTWDTAPNGIGMLHTLSSPEATKTYTYNARGQVESLTLAVKAQNEALTTGYTYDSVGRVATIAYPSLQGMPSFVVAHEYDSYGHLLKVRDNATNDVYWRLTAVDSAGRFQTEKFGNGVVSDRSYFPDKQALESITTKAGLTTLQKLTYGYDERLNLKSRIDALQAQNTTERFRYDGLERVKCAYFSINEDPLAACAQSFDYAPNGNLTFKSDVGVLTYGDPAHPHAVTTAGVDHFGYDAVGNQITRPGGMTISYAPFDLPVAMKQGATSTTFGYDGDQARIRKTTSAEDTLYFSDLYERVTDVASGSTEHRYYISSPERAVAVVTRGGMNPGTRYLHVDNLGSVVALTSENGALDEPRSFDPFGQRRNPVWGQPPPASFTNKVKRGFTGQEADHELGLVNMKGRILDPKVGRFLTTDPVISNLWHGQSFNAYAYVGNNPLTFVDPSGFEPDTPSMTPPPLDEDGMLVVYVFGEKWSKEAESPELARLFGARASSNDVGTTGDSAFDVAGPSAGSTLDDVRGSPYAQVEGGFISGVALGLVPFGAVGQQFFDAAHLLPGQTWQVRFTFSLGLFVGGLFTMLEGAGGDVAGGAATLTGVGAAVGVPAMVVSTGVVVSGVANVGAGISGMWLSMSSLGSGSGSSGPQPPAASGGGIRANAAKGAAFEAKVLAQESKSQPGMVQQLTVKTLNGVRTRLDMAGREAQTGAIKLTEAKSSATAPLTPNQRAAFPEISQTGATVVGKGKPGFPAGTQIPPSDVNIVRP